jgi:hypothetical protein
VEVKLGLLCHEAIFQGEVNFSHTDIGEVISSERAQFQGQGPDNKANFNAMKVGKNAFFDKAVFQGPVDFGGAKISGQFRAKGAQFQGQGPDNKVNFNGMKVGQSAFIDNAVFQGPVIFGGADIGGQFSAKGAQFQGQGKENKANFNAMKVGQDAFFNNAVFQGPSDFGGADIGGQFGAQRAKFQGQGPDNKANFNAMMVGLDAFFNKAVYQGPVDFGSVEIGRAFIAERAQFQGQGPDNKVNFSAIKIGQNAFFNYAVFQGPVDFITSDIGGQFNAKGVQFQVQGQENAANFNGIKVGNDAFFDNAVFQGALDFINANIGGQFNAKKAKFENENGTALFAGIKVEDIAFFDGALFKGGLTLAGARLLDLMLCDLQSPVPELSLERTVVGRELSIKNVTVGKLPARNLEVKVNAALEQVTIQEEADWRDSSFQVLHLLEVTWPENAQKVRLDGLTYKAITAGDKPGAWEKLLAWVQGSRFNTQNYSELEDYFARCGHRDRADKVYIAGKFRESRECLKELKEMSWPAPNDQPGRRKLRKSLKEMIKISWWHLRRLLLWFSHWVLWLSWGVLAGFGRKPGRVFLPALVLILLGWAIYHPVCLEKQHWLVSFQKSHPHWTGLVVSLDRFLPGVDLGVAKICKPDDLSAFVWFYWHFQKIMGWILAPIALAAIYTRIK